MRALIGLVVELSKYFTKLRLLIHFYLKYPHILVHLHVSLYLYFTIFCIYSE